MFTEFGTQFILREQSYVSPQFMTDFESDCPTKGRSLSRLDAFTDDIKELWVSATFQLS